MMYNNYYIYKEIIFYFNYLIKKITFFMNFVFNSINSSVMIETHEPPFPKDNLCLSDYPTMNHWYDILNIYASFSFFIIQFFDSLNTTVYKY